MALHRFHLSDTSIPRYLGRWVLCLVCTAVLLCSLSGCGQNQSDNSAEETSAAGQTTDAASGDSQTTGEVSGDATATDGTATNGAKADGTSTTDAAKDEAATSDNTATAKKPTPNAALAQSWSTDFQRLAEASGMDVCVSAVDLTTGATASHHGDERMLSASMIKLLIAETLLGQVADGTHSLDEAYVLKGSDIVGGAGSLGGRGAGAETNVREMLKLMIAESDNVATNVLIDLCGMDAVNAEAKRLDLKQTELGRHMMDTEAAERGEDNYTCADDLAKLLQMVWDKAFVNEEMSAVMLECLEAQTDNECISPGLPAGTTFAHKTGSLATVRHDGGIVEGEAPFVLVCLCGGEGFGEGAAQATMAQIGEAAYQDVLTTSK